MSALNDSGSDFQALQAIISALEGLDRDRQERIFRSAATFLELDLKAVPERHGSSPATTSLKTEESSAPARYPPFSSDFNTSPKDFLLQKQPRTDVERVAVLAYYLTHFRDLPQFKTLDISKLNAEAAQPKFSNAANSVANAVKTRYLIAATKGLRQLGAAGEQFVEALPDRDAARAAMAAASPRRRKKAPVRKRIATTPKEV